MAADAVTTLVPVLLSGGVGTRLWPISRELCPKQFLVLDGGSDSLLQATCRRLTGIGPVAAPVVVCNEVHRFLVAQQMAEIGCVPEAILLEPQGRNTAPALALAALHLQARGLAAQPMLVLPADHLLETGPAFTQAIDSARRLAEDGFLVTFGIRPQSPETGYGYIRRGEALPLVDAFRVAAFVEKPDAATAAAFVAGGEHVWNSGMFMMRADRYLEELAQWAPAVLAVCQDALAQAQADLDFIRLPQAALAACPAISIDYAVMEKTARAAVVPLAACWSDIGSWSALWEAGERDATGNVLRGDVLLHDVSQSLVYGESRLVALLGVDRLVVVETPDAVLVAHRDRVQDVRHIVERIRQRGGDEAVSHTRVFRPWGSYESLVSVPGFQVKRIVVNPGSSLSLQMHRQRAEHWVVVSGEAEVVCGERCFRLQHDQSTYIPVGEKHRLANPGKLPLVLIEVQTGDYLGEDDIVRFDDHYGRVAEGGDTAAGTPDGACP